MALSSLACIFINCDYLVVGHISHCTTAQTTVSVFLFFLFIFKKNVFIFFKAVVAKIWQPAVILWYMASSHGKLLQVETLNFSLK